MAISWKTARITWRGGDHRGDHPGDPAPMDGPRFFGSDTGNNDQESHGLLEKHERLVFCSSLACYLFIFQFIYIYIL